MAKTRALIEVLQACLVFWKQIKNSPGRRQRITTVQARKALSAVVPYNILVAIAVSLTFPLSAFVSLSETFTLLVIAIVV
jgi:hypothetical protein